MGRTQPSKSGSGITVRLARPSDLETLLSPPFEITPERAGELELSLALQPGDDFFFLVAESQHRGATIVGWCCAGGCRGQEHKGWGELYQLASLKGWRVAALRALAGRASSLLEQAAFAGVTVDLELDDDEGHRALASLGFVHEPSTGPTTVRYLLAFPARRIQLDTEP